ncbi:MAG: MFS transporter [Candidatus Asgardarchaeia archaeon]
MSLPSFKPQISSGKMLYQSEKPQWVHWKILAFGWLGWIFDFYDLILYSFLLIPIMHEFALSSMDVALVYSFSLLATAIGGISFGTIADKFGRKTTLFLTILLYSLGTFLSGFATNVYNLLLFRAITGFGVGGEWAVAQVLINETFPPHMKGRAGAFLQSGAPVGVGISAVIGGFLMGNIGWRLCFIYSAVPSFIVAFLLLKMIPESDIWIKHKEAMKTRIVADGGRRRNIINMLKGNSRNMMLGTLAATFAMFAYWLIFSWLPTYLSQQRGMDIGTSGLWILLSQVGALIGYLSFGFVADHIGRRAAFSIYAGIQATGVAFLTVLWSTPEIALISIFMIGVGSGYFSGFGPLYSELYPTNVRCTLAGASFNIGRGLAFFAPLIVAVLSSTMGMAIGMALAILFNVLLGTFIWLLPETKGKVLDEMAL